MSLLALFLGNSISDIFMSFQKEMLCPCHSYLLLTLALLGGREPAGPGFFVSTLWYQVFRRKYRSTSQGVSQMITNNDEETVV